MSIAKLAAEATGLVVFASLLAACASGRPTTGLPGLSLTPPLLPADPTAYPPPQATPEPTPTLDLRPVTLASSPYAAILTLLQQALDDGDSAALVARQAELLVVSGAEMSEGNKVFSPEDTQRILDAFFRAGSKPRIDGYFVETSAGQPGFACLGIVTRGWAGTVAAPTDTPGPTYGESWPADFPAGWWGWVLCTTEGTAWWWDTWLWFGSEAAVGGVDAMRADLRVWSYSKRWNVGDHPSTWTSTAQPTYYALGNAGQQPDAP